MKVVVLLLLAVSQISAGWQYPKSKYDPQHDLTRVFNVAPSIDEGLRIARREGKPIMLIVHMTSCPACKKLLPKLMASPELKVLGNDFVILNSYDGDDERINSIGPDGIYFPRIIFFGSDSRMLPQIKNPNQPDYSYYYDNAAEVARSMRYALYLNRNSRYY